VKIIKNSKHFKIIHILGRKEGSKEGRNDFLSFSCHCGKKLMIIIGAPHHTINELPYYYNIILQLQWEGTNLVFENECLNPKFFLGSYIYIHTYIIGKNTISPKNNNNNPIVKTVH